MNIALMIVDWIGRIMTLMLILGVIWGVILWIRGIIPVLYRLGNGLSKRKIVVIAKKEHFDYIKNLLLESKLFWEKNIYKISDRDDIWKTEEERAIIYLVYWTDWEKEIDDILSMKDRNIKSALIIYAPPGSIPKDRMEQLDGKRNTSVTNFRGRLLNDVVTAMITTSYQK